MGRSSRFPTQAMEYERSAPPLEDSGALSPLFLLSKGKKHWFALIQGDEETVFQLSKSNYGEVLNAIESKTGQKVKMIAAEANRYPNGGPGRSFLQCCRPRLTLPIPTVGAEFEDRKIFPRHRVAPAPLRRPRTATRLRLRRVPGLSNPFTAKVRGSFCDPDAHPLGLP